MVVYMTEDSAIQTEFKPANPYPKSWILATFLLTPATAMFLAHYGFIPRDLVSAAIDGFLVALMYVGFRVGYRHWTLSTRTETDAVDSISNM